MNTEDIKVAYRANLKERITIRRYAGAGAQRPRFDVTVRGKARTYGATELIGSISQGDQEVILLVDDLIEQGFVLPVTINDKIVVGGKEMAIIAPNTRKSEDGTLIAYDCQCRG